MKITIYELLGLVKDGKVPKKIKYEYLIYELTPERNDYYCKNEMRWFTNEINCLGVLNDYVEIIEEDKKIEELDVQYYDDERYTPETRLNICMNYINKLIAEVNKLK
jgi:hypothetical protein